MKNNILQITNKAARVKLADHVDKWSMDELIEEIDRTYGADAAANGLVDGEITNCIENAADTLDIEIHSPGGSVLDGYRAYNAIQDLRKRGVYVTAHIQLAASMASVIAMAADKIVMRTGSKMMIHEASAATHGDAQKHANTAELLESISDEIAAIYAGRTKIPKDEIRASMKKETWMNAKQAVEMGFADEIFDTATKAESETTMSILDRLTNPSDAEAVARIEALEASIASSEAARAEIEAKLATAESALQEAATEATAIRAQLAEASEQLVTAQAKADELASQADELKAAAEMTEEKIAARASELLAAQGHKAPVNMQAEENAPMTTTDQFWATYRELQKTDAKAATEYFRANAESAGVKLQ